VAEEEMRTTGLKILITGGGSGIGLALAKYIEPRNTVVIAGRDEEKLERARHETPSLRALRLDVTSEQDVRECMAWLESELGGLDVVVNNAGILEGFALGDADAQAKSDEEVQVNLLGPLRVTRHALPLLSKADEAAVVFVSSAAALVAAPRLAVYASTKAAVHSLARSLRREFVPDSIRIFEVQAPWIDTDLVRDFAVPKMPPQAVADAVVRGLARDRYEIRVGRVRGLALINRFAPAVADRLFARASP
jgi:uncharacterized oxidoreductase